MIYANRTDDDSGTLSFCFHCSPSPFTVPTSAHWWSEMKSGKIFESNDNIKPVSSNICQVDLSSFSLHSFDSTHFRLGEWLFATAKYLQNFFYPSTEIMWWKGHDTSDQICSSQYLNMSKEKYFLTDWKIVFSSSHSVTTYKFWGDFFFTANQHYLNVKLVCRNDEFS